MKFAENIQNRVKPLLTIKLSMLFYSDLTSMLNGWHGREGEYVWRMSLFANPKQSAKQIETMTMLASRGNEHHG